MSAKARQEAAEGVSRPVKWLCHTLTADGVRGVLRAIGRTPDEAVASLPAGHAPVVAVEPL